MIKVLALDIAMHRTGWAVGSADGSPPSWGVFETENWKDNEGENLAAFRNQVLRKHTFLTHIVIEEVFVDVRNASRFQYNGTHAQMQLQAMALLYCHDEMITPLTANISDWRMRFLGMNRKPKDFKGDANYWKTLALKAAADRNWYCEHHDSAEALGIMDFALANLDKEYKLRTNPILNRKQADITFKRGAHA